MRLLVGLLAVCAWAVEPPAVPDPLELGERLALIDHLQQAYGQKPAAGASLEDLRAAYAAAWRAAQPPDTAAQEAADRADREQRLRRQLIDRHRITPPAEASEAELLALLRAAQDGKRTQDDAAIAAMLAQDAATPDPPSRPQRSAADQRRPVDPRAQESQPQSEPLASDGPRVQRVALKQPGVVSSFVITDATHSGLVVIMGVDHNGAYQGIPESFWAILSSSPTIKRGALLLGHGTGVSIGGESVDGHLRANKAFYESQGGTAPAQQLECLVLASCSAGNSSQMMLMRNGLGYYPTWRVATSPNAYATGQVVMTAFSIIAGKPAGTPFRGLFRFGAKGDDIGAWGEVGIDGARGNVEYLRVLPDGVVVEQR